MLAGISVVCFAASYAVALALEVTRLFFRSGVRGALMLGFGGAGLAAHSLLLLARAAAAAPRTAPLSSWFDWYLLAAWVLAAGYLYLTVYHRQTPMGLFVLPLVLALVGVAHMAGDEAPLAAAEAFRAWGTIHGVSLLLGTVVVTAGFLAGVMYLIQAARLKRKVPASGRLRLPSLEWLERVNLRSLVISTLCLAVGVASGVVLSVRTERHGTMTSAWSDPAVWSSGLLFAWLLAAVIFSAVYKPARRGRKVAYLTVASFVFLLGALVLTTFFTAHGGAASSTL